MKRQTNWTESEKNQILKLVQENTLNSRINWKNISEQLIGRSALQCKMQYRNVLNQQAERVNFKWTPENEQKLEELLLKKSYEQIQQEHFSQLKISQLKWKHQQLKQQKEFKWNAENDLELEFLIYIFGTKWEFIQKFYPNAEVEEVQNKYRQIRSTMLLYYETTNKVQDTQLTFDQIFALQYGLNRIQLMKSQLKTYIKFLQKVFINDTFQIKQLMLAVQEENVINSREREKIAIQNLQLQQNWQNKTSQYIQRNIPSLLSIVRIIYGTNIIQYFQNLSFTHKQGG
ncbi:Myb-like_DNA-binding domain-containing protein [Hexamita inflata]|uniref:Myb-like DNA-binding domain-containing protein n=1 Tax=Hexamita inflata TaxID=28002 RepID=A0AA86TNK8_9EUKA|nr:Myb-like DNA-binding domain-containing protein [Hexamita inflata]